MSHVPNRIHLHGTSYQLGRCSVGSNITSSNNYQTSFACIPSIIATAKFSTITFNDRQQDGFDDDNGDGGGCEDDNGDDFYSPPDSSVDVLESVEEALKREEDMQDDMFIDGFMSDVNVSSLDSNYKCPKISFMVRANI